MAKDQGKIDYADLVRQISAADMAQDERDLALLLGGYEGRKVPEEEVLALLGWVAEMERVATILDLFRRGIVHLRFHDGERTVQLTEAGAAMGAQFCEKE